MAFSKFILIKPDAASGRVKEIFEDIKKSMGHPKFLVPTWGFFAHDPELLEHWWGLTKRLSVKEGRVPKKILNAISVLCASEAKCPRCLTYHSLHLMETSGITMEEVERLLDFETSPAVSEKERVALRFARKVAFGEETTEDDLNALRAEEYDDVAIVEIVSMALLESSMARRAIGCAKFEDGEAWPDEHVPSETYRKNIYA